VLMLCRCEHTTANPTTANPYSTPDPHELAGHMKTIDMHNVDTHDFS